MTEKTTQSAECLSRLTAELGTLRPITKEDLFKINIPDLTGAYVYKSLLHNGYLICKDEGMQQIPIIRSVFNTKLDAEAYIALRTSA